MEVKDVYGRNFPERGGSPGIYGTSPEIAGAGDKTGEFLFRLADPRLGGSQCRGDEPESGFHGVAAK